MYEDGFDRALEKASSDQSPETGKKLPQGDPMSREKSLDSKLRENQTKLLQQSHHLHCPMGALNQGHDQAHVEKCFSGFFVHTIYA